MRASFFVLPALLLFTASRADTGDGAANASGLLQSLNGPSATAAGPSDGVKASAQASGSSSQASTKLSHIWALTDSGALNGNLTAAAPFSGTNTPKADVGSVSTLSAGVNTRLDAGWIFLPKPRSEGDVNAITNKYNDICDTFIGHALGDRYYYNVTPARLQEDPKSIYALSLIDKVPTCDDLTQGSNLPDFVKTVNAQIAARNKTTSNSAEPLLQVQSGWRKLAKQASQDFAKLTADHPAPLQALSFSFLGNEHSYSYVTTAAPTKVINQSGEGYGVGVNYAYYEDTMSIIAGFSYERPFKNGKGQQVCNPIGMSTSTTCSTASVGAPTRIYSRIFSLEGRLLLVGSFAMGPRVEYDEATSNYGIKLPLYFVPNAKKLLTGGLEFGWTKQNRYQGAIVIQKAFSFWN